MSVKCDNSRSLYPYAGAAHMLPCGPAYGDRDGDAYSWRGNVDNEYAYVDELLPPPPPASRHQSPPRDYAPTNNNLAYAARARQPVPADHVTGCLQACRQHDAAPGDDRPRVDVAAN